MRSSRRTFISSIFAPACVALVAACTPAAPQVSSTVAPAAQSQPSTSGTLNVGVTTEPATLDPQFGNGLNEFMVTINVMDGLVAFGPDLSIQPLLAETFHQVDDTTWEFKLRQGVKFHNGEALTADAVKASFDRSRDTSLKIRNPWAQEINLAEVEILDPLLFRMHTSTPTPQMLSRLAKDYPLYPPAYVSSTPASTVARKPMGTGAYMLKEWVTGDHITLEANPEYWGTPKPRIQTVVWRWIPEYTTRLDNVRTGAIDVMTSLDPSSINDVNAAANSQAVVIHGGRRVYVGFNTTTGPLQDVRVRQALNYGADIESICKTIFNGATERMKTWSNPPYENPDVKGYSYDPAKAKQLLQDAGYGQGFEVAWDVDNGGYLKSEEFPSALANSLRGIGVNVSIKKVESTVAAQQQKERKTSPMYLRSNTAQYDAGLDFDVWRFDHAGNATLWNDAQFALLLKQLYTGGTADQRQQWSYQAQVRLSEQAPMLFLWKQPEIYAINKRAQGFKPNGTERFMLHQVSLGS